MQYIHVDFFSQKMRNVSLKLSRTLMYQNTVQELFPQSGVQIDANVSSLRRACKDQREGEKLIPEVLIFIR